MYEIYYATSNPGKFNDVKSYLESHSTGIVLKQFIDNSPEIQSDSQEEIALDKARKAFQILGKPVLVDDSGIYFHQYNNFPGTMTKFIHKGIGTEGILKLVDSDNRAKFALIMAYFDGNQEKTFVGTCEGTIIKPQAKTQFPKAFPWNPLFLPNGSSKTYAELENTEAKNNYDYRIQALKKFIAWHMKWNKHEKQSQESSI